MRIQIITALPLIAGTLFSCGQSLDVGSNPGNPIAKCAPASASPRMLNDLSSFPDFFALSMVVTDDAAYVGGVVLPAGNWSKGAKEVGRIFKFPLNGAEPREVWRGVSFAGNLRLFGDKIAFFETDGRRLRYPGPNYPGLHVYDIATELTVDIPNLQSRNFIESFEFGREGLVFSAGTFVVDEPTHVTRDESYSIARVRIGELEPSTLLNLTNQKPSLFKRGDSVLVDMLADESERGYDSATSEPTQKAVFSIGPTELWLEQRFAANAYVDTTWRALFADEQHYYHMQTTSDSSYLSTSSKSPHRETSGSTLFIEAALASPPILDGANIYWRAPRDASMLRRTTLNRINAHSSNYNQLNGMKATVDLGRVISVFGVNACTIVWVSISTFDEKQIPQSPKRLMLNSLD